MNILRDVPPYLDHSCCQNLYLFIPVIHTNSAPRIQTSHRIYPCLMHPKADFAIQGSYFLHIVGVVQQQGR